MNIEIITNYESKLIANGYSQTTCKNYKSAMMQYCKWSDSNSNLSIDIIKEYVVFLKSVNKSYSTIKIAVTSLILYSELVMQNSLRGDYLKGVKQKRKMPEVLTLSEVRQLVNSIDNLKHKTIVALIYSCGLKTSECIRLKRSDIDFKNTKLRVFTQNQSKIRLVSLPKKIIIMLKQYIKEYQITNHLFIGISGDEISPRTIQSILKKSGEKIGLSKDVTPQSLRHSYGTHLVEQGIDLRIIQRILGHSDIRTTQIYSHISNVNIDDINNPFCKL